jgi:putative ABC transport system permease protein
MRSLLFAGDGALTFEKSMQLLFDATLAVRAIRSNGLRTVLTVLIIAVGITALVGILTAFEVLKKNVTQSFSSMGANSFQITSEIIRSKKKKRGVSISVDEAKPIRYEEARQFKQRFNFPATVGISGSFSNITTVRYGSQKTNPNVQKSGVDEAYLSIAATKLESGRNFSRYELQTGGYVCILGHSVAKKLFKNNLKDAAGRVVSVGEVKYRVVGVAEEQGGSMRMNADNLVLVPLSNARAVHGEQNVSYIISVAVNDAKAKAFASEEAEGLMRIIRRIPLGAEANFSVSGNDSIAAILMDSLKYLLGAAVVIAIITLLGSIIGLMNIMLVSVAERTREIGVSKALGARSATIRRQFLLESIIIGVLGGFLGAVMGLGVGNLLGLAFHSGFVVPWLWMGLGIALCALAGIISGLYPAVKASKLDPIVALRYE